MIGAGLELTIPVDEADPESIPKEYSLSQNYPNPFNSNTAIAFALPKREFVTLKIYDILGREVTTLVSGYKEAGYYQFDNAANGLTSGVYFYRIQAGRFVEVKKMFYIR